ncbi:MAG: leucine-rich repeat domain-containing protein [Candidatus Poribacteria bacterium]|nr:leucine-rich repeat domain-containing protein [Candidatus Poribacteria bacterium]
MRNWKIFITIICLSMLILGIRQNVDAQENLAQQAYAIFEQNCFNCHGEHGAYTEQLIIEHAALVAPGGAVIPGNPQASEFYQRLIETAPERRMPLNAPPLSQPAIDTIRDWIAAGAPDWQDTFESDGPFITPKEMLETIENHVNSLAPFDRTFARYFTLTHLYNAGETTEALLAYRRALSKLVNSLSWGRKISNPRPIDSEETIFYIDLRDYEWEIGINRWTLIEAEYPYGIAFNAPTQTALREKLTNLREELDCEVPFVHIDWFLATASLPPLYHDILGLPETDRELETRLEVNIVENLRNAAGRRVWRAGFNDSGVSNHNRVVERHESRYGAYWKSYDFAGSVGTQNIFTHPLAFEHDGGEIIFNLPNGLQAYLLVDAGGNRLNTAPISIVRNPAASDPTVRNGLSCIGCHTEGMKVFEDEVRSVVEQSPNPPFDKDRALRLYTDQATMDVLVAEDTQRYREALWEAGGVFGGIEPIQRFHEAFQGPVDASHAAAAVGLETERFLQNLRQNTSLQNLGLLVLENGTMKRDTWTEQFSEIMFALDFPERSRETAVERQTERIPGESVHIPDPNLRVAIAEALGKTPGTPMTAEEMQMLTYLHVEGRDIHDLTGIETAINLREFHAADTSISDLTPLASLTKLTHLGLNSTRVSDLTPLVGLTELRSLYFAYTRVSDLKPLANLPIRDIFMVDAPVDDLTGIETLTQLESLLAWGTLISDLTPLAGLTKLRSLNFHGAQHIKDLKPLANLTSLTELYLTDNQISDISPLAGLVSLKHLHLKNNQISDISPLEKLTQLQRLGLGQNLISDVSSLTKLTQLKWLGIYNNLISDLSPLEPLLESIIILSHSNPGFHGGPKIEGPWLWVTVPGELDDGGRAHLSNMDMLAAASNNRVTEQEIATHGATVGKAVGDSTWIAGELDGAERGNINTMLRTLGLNPPEHPPYIVYGSITLYSPRKQDTKMYVGSDMNSKVWLNGMLIRKNGGSYVDQDYQTFFPVTLKQGKNALLVAIDNADGDAWSGYFGFALGTKYTVSNSGIGYSLPQTAIHIDDIFTVQLNAENISDLAGWQFDIVFDPTVLEAVEVNEGDFLQTGGGTTFFQKGAIDNTTGKITKLSSARLSEDGVSGKGTLLSVTFRAKTAGQTQLKLDNFQLAAITGASIPVTPHEVEIIVEGRLATGDVNRDGQVSILDMVLVARHLGKTVPPDSNVDLNGDGVVNIQDLIIVAQHLGESTISAAPSMTGEELNPAMIQAWIAQAQVENDGSIAFQQGIANLQRLLASLLPEETALLPNYPNPFNPETWIPYQLAEPVEVTLKIYAVNGTLVRTLALGQMPAGTYQSRARAAYWNGKNDVGESVANGVYFYTLTAGEFTSTRKMLIRK